MNKQEVDIKSLIDLLRQCSTDEIRFEEIEKMPEDIRMKLLPYVNKIYDANKPTINERGFRIIRNCLGQVYLFRHIGNLEYEDKLEMLKNLTDKNKLAYLEEVKETDKTLLDMLDSVKNPIYKLVFVGKITDKNSRVKELEKLDVKKSFLYYTEGIGERSEINPNNRKYNVIGLPKEITFGIEIECFNKDYAKYLVNKGEFFINHSDKNGRWICKEEPSANEHEVFPETGLECESRILNDSKDNVEEIYETCNFLDDLGFKTNEKCGGHIHFGRDYLKTPRQLWNVIELYGKCEDVMNLILNEPNSLSRNGLNIYARPTYKTLLVKGFDPDKFEDIEKCIERIQIRTQRNKHFDVNVSTLHPTIEFRAPNGTVNPNTWIENIKLLGNLIVVGKGLETGNITNIDKKRELFNAIKSEEDISKKCDMLLDLLFDDEKDKDIYSQRFNSNKVLKYGKSDYEQLHEMLQNQILEEKDERGEI